MNLRNKITIIFILHLLCNHSFSQGSVSRYPIRFDQYYSCYATVNPSAAGTLSMNEFSVGNQRLMGNFSSISTYYFNANFRLQKIRLEDGSFSTLGLIIYNDKEGKYLNRTRAYALYSWHSKLTTKINFSGGFSIGGMSYFVKGTALSGGGSDLVPDGSLGIRFYNNSFHVGIAASQVFNNKVQPIEEITYLKTFINLTGSKLFIISDNVRMTPHFNLRLNWRNSENRLDINVNTEIGKLLFITAGIHNNDNISLGTGINGLNVSSSNMNIFLTYTVPAKSSDINTSHLELGINFLR